MGSHWFDRYNRGEGMEDSIYKTKEASQEDKRKEFLAEVESKVNVERQQDYGEALKNFQRIATLWNIYLDGDGLTPQDVAIMMILHKISRLKTSRNHRDSWIDIAGYACLAGTME